MFTQEPKKRKNNYGFHYYNEYILTGHKLILLYAEKWVYATENQGINASTQNYAQVKSPSS